jgi:hypothetical protein
MADLTRIVILGRTVLREADERVGLLGDQHAAPASRLRAHDLLPVAPPVRRQLLDMPRLGGVIAIRRLPGEQVQGLQRVGVGQLRGHDFHAASLPVRAPHGPCERKSS